MIMNRFLGLFISPFLYASMGLCLVFCEVSWGQLLPLDESQTTKENFKDKTYRLEAQLFSFYYPSPAENGQTHENEMTLVGRYFKEISNTQRLKAVGFTGGYPENDFTFFAVPEVYYQEDLSQSSYRWTFGRYKKELSCLDEKMNIGFFQPYVTQDFLRYTQQGNIGWFSETRNIFWNWSLGWHTFYLPSQGPLVREIDGRIITSTRWAANPPSDFEFNNENKKIIYSIKDYKLEDMVLKQGAHAQIKIGEAGRTPVLSATYAYQPLNDIVIERETYANLNFVGNVNLQPLTIYSRILSVDFKYQQPQYFGYISYMEDHPINQQASPYYSIQNLESIRGVGVGVGGTIHQFIFDKISLELNYARFSGGNIVDLNNDGTVNIFTFSKQRLKLMSPIQFQLKTESVFFVNQKIENDFKFIYDDQQKGAILNYKMSYFPNSLISFYAGVDILGKQDENKKEDLFLDQNKSNDRYVAGVNYVF